MKRLAFLATVLVLAGCAADTGQPTADAGQPVADAGQVASDADGLDAVYDRFTAAYEAGAPEAVVALYTDDAFYLPGGDGTPILQGQSALRDQFSFVADRKAQGVGLTIAFDIVNRTVEGDQAVDVGYYKITSTQPDGTQGVSVGKFVGVLVRGDDGQWRFRIDGYSGAPEAAFGAGS